MTTNPFVRLYEAPIETLTALAYALVLLSVSVALLGVAWNFVVRLDRAWEYRGVAGKYGPKWRYVPPLNIIGLCAVVLFLCAVELAMWAGIIHVLT